MKTRLSVKNFAHLGFFAASALIVLMGWSLYNATAKLNESLQWVTHTTTALLEIEEVGEEFFRAESAIRGYLLSSNGSYIDRREKAVSEVNEALAALKKLTLDNPLQQARIEALKERISQFAAVSDEIVRLQKSGKALTAQARSVSALSQQISGDIYVSVKALEEEELRLLEMRRADGKKHSQTLSIVLAVTMALSAVVLLPAYVGFSYQSGARERAERQVRDIAESLPGAVFQMRTRSDGSVRRFEFLSNSVERLRHIDRREALRDWSIITNTILEEDRPRALVALKKAAETLVPVLDDYRTKQPDGTIRWLRTSATIRKEPDGSILWNGHWADVTEEKLLHNALHEAKEAADAASRAKTSFLATMSHEIRTPMYGIVGMLELLKLTKLDAEQSSNLEVMRDSAKSLLQIIDDILDFSKIEAGKVELRPEVASIGTQVDAVVNVYRGIASSKGLVFERKTDAQISPAYLVDPLRLRQILNNLVSNAIKFTTQGRIEIRAELAGRNNGHEIIRFLVADTGIGISPEQQKQLFRPFVQADRDTTRRFGGTGLGLMISKRFAEMMGGSLEMLSEVGKGTTMILTLSLPIADPKDLPKASPDITREALSTTINMRRLPPSVVEAETEGTLVLLADDHPTNRKLLLRQVNNLGYAAEVAENGAEALEKWKSARFAAVITDCNMPEMDGYELARRIRTFESAGEAKRTPIIACTANALRGEAERCLAAGMDDYLAKPIELIDLCRKLDQWLPIPGAQKRGSGRRHKDGKPAARDPVDKPRPIDRSALAGISGGNAESEREILADFRRVNDADTAKLKQAVDNRQLDQVKHAAHRIKGAGRTIGAAALAAVCERLENASRAADWNVIQATMELFDRELERLNAYLEGT